MMERGQPGMGGGRCIEASALTSIRLKTIMTGLRIDLDADQLRQPDPLGTGPSETDRIVTLPHPIIEWQRAEDLAPTDFFFDYSKWSGQ